jgi:4-hydroxythreonine-4-phosphate dehydrogenase
MDNITKPVIGFTCGDLNGVGLEITLKALADNKILDYCTPVIFASSKAVNFYRKTMGDLNFSFFSIKELNKLNPKQINVLNLWEEEVQIQPGAVTQEAGQYAIKSLLAATQALQQGHIQAMVTAPINKANVQSAEFPYTGHTPFLKKQFNANTIMLMTAENMRVALLTEHVALTDVKANINKDKIVSNLQQLEKTLKQDFAISKPKIAVLALNPHAGDDGLIGKEEQEIIAPAIKELKQRSNSIFMGPYSADAFFARSQYQHFDAVLAMYHDQGLIPFKSLSIGQSINYTAGLPAVRTSPDHGTAYDIAGKNMADESSLLASIFLAIDIIKQRKLYEEINANKLTKTSHKVMGNVADEKIAED